MSTFTSDPGWRGRWQTFVELVRFEQTLFALPFAYAGMLLAQRGLPSFEVCFWVTLAMFGARTAGMAANRWIDWKIDAANPRTAQRSLPAGKVAGSSVLALLAVSLALLALAAYQLNPLCYRLWPLAALLLMGYSYTKRFTWLCHAWLGLVQACAPIGGWLAVAGEWAATPLWLGLAIFTWVAGFDVLYACQDFDHDRKVGLSSIPARFGIQKAFRISEGLHVVAWLALAAVGGCAGLGLVYALALGAIAALLYYEHRILRPDDLSQMQRAFFQANVGISLTLLGALLWELL
jgi:4-hydroxybenzoate polyprenyltransferase